MRVRVRVAVRMPGVGRGRVTVQFGMQLLRLGNDLGLHFPGHLFVMAEILGVDTSSAGQ